MLCIISLFLYKKISFGKIIGVNLPKLCVLFIFLLFAKKQNFFFEVLKNILYVCGVKILTKLKERLLGLTS
jgi:hypothetical protein